MNANQPSTSLDITNRDVTFEIISTNKGRHLHRAGYDYLYKRINKDESELWRCLKKRSCNATIKLKNQSVIHETNHNHPPKDLATIMLQSEIEQCYKNVESNPATPISTIYENTVDKIKDTGLDLIASPMPSFKNMKKNLYKRRNKALGVKKVEFQKAIDIKIPEKYQNLVFADYTHGKKRILIFCNEKMIKYLVEATHFFMDGTFKLCQKNFYQLYSIHADIGSNVDYINVIPILYVLLPDKKLATYNILFSLIKARVPQWNPSKVSMDFEVPAILALKSLVPNVQVIGCYFHFTRCLWRKAKEIGVTKCKFGRLHIKLCTALAHLPPHLISDGWLYIMEECPNIKEITLFNNYFVSTWLDNEIYAPLWCSYGEQHTTNNIVEAWNNHLKRYLKPKPNIVQFLEGIKKDSNFYCEKLKESPNISKRTPESIETRNRITRAVESLMSGQINIALFLEKLKF